MKTEYIKNYSGMILLVLLLLSFVSADCTNYGTFKQNTAISLTQTCTSCSTVNATITLPDSSSSRNNTFQCLHFKLQRHTTSHMERNNSKHHKNLHVSRNSRRQHSIHPCLKSKPSSIPIHIQHSRLLRNEKPIP